MRIVLHGTASALSILACSLAGCSSGSSSEASGRAASSPATGRLGAGGAAGAQASSGQSASSTGSQGSSSGSGGGMQAMFPVKISPDKGSLVDNSGKPFLIQGDTAWSAIAELSEQDA